MNKRKKKTNSISDGIEELRERIECQELAIEEYGQLEDRIEKLSAFQISDEFDLIDQEDRKLFGMQLHHMVKYSEILTARIVRFNLE